MPKKIRAVFDTSSIIFLDHLNYLTALRSLHEVVITPVVAWELTQHKSGAGSKVPDWIEQINPKASFLAKVKKEANLDVGESSVIALALDTELLIVLDDNSARRFAVKQGLRITGTLGVLLELHRRELATRSLNDDLQLLSDFGMFISDELKSLILASL